MVAHVDLPSKLYRQRRNIPTSCTLLVMAWPGWQTVPGRLFRADGPRACMLFGAAKSFWSSLPLSSRAGLVVTCNPGCKPHDRRDADAKRNGAESQSATSSHPTARSATTLPRCNNGTWYRCRMAQSRPRKAQWHFCHVTSVSGTTVTPTRHARAHGNSGQVDKVRPSPVLS